MDSLKTEKIRVRKQAEVFITKTATQTLTNPSTVEKVMNFHFRDLIRALKTYQTVELTGFGRLTLSPNKLKVRLKALKKYRERVLSEQLDDPERIERLNKDIKYLEERDTLDETKRESYLRRMAQSLGSPEKIEGSN
jgi:hypothetical protein